jgi:predicted secreted protein with PEFG-CTERM motif
MALQYMVYASLVLTLSLVTIPAFGSSHNIPPLSVTTDSDSYEQGDTIVITGLVKNLEEGIPITLRILDPTSKLVGIDQFSPAGDGTFSKTYVATGPLWKAAGNYTVIVQYGSAQQADVEFSFGGGDGSSVTTPAVKKKFTVDAGDQGTYDVEYIIKGGSVENIEIDYDGLALIVTINAEKDGSLTLTMPRSLIDAKKPADLSADDILAGKTVDPKDLEDDQFFVLIGGEEAAFKETKSSTSRTLSINFAAGDSEIEIVGTQVVPEFGAVAALILAVAIISIIAVSAKTRLRLVPKY